VQVRIALFAVVALVCVGVSPAFAATPFVGGETATMAARQGSSDTPVAPDVPPTMGDYPLSAYSAEAATLPAPLVNALHAVGQTPEQYLAQAAAATDAAAVIQELGGSVLGSRLNGTRLIVNVATEQDATAVEKLRAVADFSAPSKRTFDTSNAKLMQDLSGGEAIYFANHRCSIGFNGNRISDGAPEFSTAGHCASSASDEYDWLSQTGAGQGFALGARIGATVPSSFQFGGGFDVGLVQVDPTSSWVLRPRVITWQGGTGTPTTTTDVLDRIPAIVGATLCKSGATSGWTCGGVLATDYDAAVGPVGQQQHINSIITSTCLQAGDSGGAGVIGGAAVGIDSFARTDVPCSDPNYFSGLFPLVSTDSSKASVFSANGSVWEPAVTVANPAIVSPAVNGSVLPSGSITGTLAGGNVRHIVNVFIDGSSTPRTSMVATDGTWSVPVSGITPGSHSVTVQGRWGTWSQSEVSAAQAFVVVGASISGTVTGTSSPSNVAAGGICVDAVTTGIVASTTTDSAGHYAFTGLPADDHYTLHFTDCTAGGVIYEDRWFGDQDTQATATSFSVGATATLTDKNAVLLVAGSFSDVRRSSSFFTYIQWMFDNNISTGTVTASGRLYKPSDVVSRQAMAAFLYRAAGSPAFTPPNVPSFSDVPTSSTFYKQIEWMKAQGVSTGTNMGDGTFQYKPLDAVSRQAMSAFLYRAAGSPAYTPPLTPSFTDVAPGSPFYLYVEWMKNQAITTGYNDGVTYSYHPAASVSRQAMAAFLYRAHHTL